MMKTTRHTGGDFRARSARSVKGFILTGSLMVYITKLLGIPFVMNALATSFSVRITLLRRPLTDEIIIIIMYYLWDV